MAAFLRSPAAAMVSKRVNWLPCRTDQGMAKTIAISAAAPFAFLFGWKNRKKNRDQYQSREKRAEKSILSGRIHGS